MYDSREGERCSLDLEGFPAHVTAILRWSTTDPCISFCACSRPISSIPLCQDIFSMRVRIHFVLLEITGLDSTCEEDVELLKGLVLGLRQAKPGPKKEESCTAAPEESSLALPVAGSRVKHVWIDDVADDLRYVICDTAEADTLVP